MDLIEYRQGLRNRHPWEISRAQFFTKLLKKHLQHKKIATVLDVGSGDAYFAQQTLHTFPELDELYCWDHEYTPELISKLSPGDKRISLQKNKPTTEFDTLLLMDVLEHIERDQDFLQNLVKDHLKPGGHVLVSVPAWPKLFSQHDISLNHHRRYKPQSIEKIVAESGLKIIEKGQLFRCLYFVRKFEVQKSQNLKNSSPTRLEDWNHGPLFSHLVASVLSLDGTLFKFLESFGVQLPGLSWWSICQKLP